MAEFVQLRKEKWIDAVGWLRKLEILKDEEFRSIVKDIDAYEYKIQSPNRKLQDVLTYIQFLSSFLKYIQTKRRDLEQHDKTEEVDRFIYNEIHSQFGSAEINFSHNFQFWNARLKFVATVVPEQDRENEFNRVFKKALNYCARANLDFYKYCVEFQWSLLKLPPERHPAAKKKKRLERRDCSKLMDVIRETTRTALRNFPKMMEATIWVLTTEFKYLCVLNQEKEDHDDTPFDFEEETEKTEKLIQVLYLSFQGTYKETLLAYCQLYDAVKVYSLPQAKQLAKEVLRHILKIQPRPLQVISWLIRNSMNDNKVDEFLERVNQAFSCPFKVKALEICVERLDIFLQKLLSSKDSSSKGGLAKLIRFSMTIYDTQSEWNQISSEKYLTGRVQFIKTLKAVKKSSHSDLELVSATKIFLQRHPLPKIVLNSVKSHSSSFLLVRERVQYLLKLNRKAKSTKPAVILKYLSGIDWKKVDNEEAQKFLNFVYRVFAIIPKFNKKQGDLLKLSIKHPAMYELRILHMRMAYAEDVEVGRDFYKNYSKLSSDWKFATAAVEIETGFCRGKKDGSLSVFKRALEDSQRLSRTTSTVPWKTGVKCLRTLGFEKDGSELLQRALAEFSDKPDLSEKHKDLLLFSASLKNAF